MFWIQYFPYFIDNSFTIKFEKNNILPLQSNKKVYQDVIEYFINEKLRGVRFQERYNKYKVSNPITSAFISEIKSPLSSDDKQFRLRREYNYSIKLSEENKAQIWLNIRSELETSKTIFDLYNKKKDVEGIKVINDWGKFGETGVITSIGPETVVDDLPNFKSLKQYMIDTKQEYRIKDCSDDSPVVHVKMNNGKDICYYPQALKPIVTLERIASLSSSERSVLSSL